jgi:hypothetical protein
LVGSVLPELVPDDVPVLPVPLLLDVPPVPVPDVPVPVLPERSLVDGELGLPLMPPGEPLGPERVDDDEELLPVSRPCVLSRSEQAPSASALNAAAIATPIALALITFITAPGFDAGKVFPPGGIPDAPAAVTRLGETL